MILDILYPIFRFDPAGISYWFKMGRFNDFFQLFTAKKAKAKEQEKHIASAREKFGRRR
ncbi:hypothetical protein [Rhodocytophaga aerolata]|uniref:hypothetical protein n=1 Tax=Rhodocytophaga aerolata TaxID=455078 RepID=UPI00366D6A92